MARVEFWVIRPTGCEPDLPSLVSQRYRDEMYLSPHVRLCGLEGMAHIETESLARSFSDGCTPILKKRYGSSISLRIEVASASDKLVRQRIFDHSDIIRKRLASGNFAPNKTPK